MDIVDTVLPGIKILTPTRLVDDRGYFSETYSRRSLANAGISVDFVQDNHAFSKRAGTVRGLHFQIPPFAQDKLLRVVRGAVLDVIVDIRQGSPTFGRHLRLELSARDWRQVFIPAGFAHGMCTLEPDTEVIYKVTNFYSAAHDKGVRWNDPALAIDWPVSAADATISPKDQTLPFFADLPPYFAHAESRTSGALSA